MHLAREFGFCYGVDRAVDYAYQTRKRFPDRTLFLTGEIIHNPHVNDQIRAQGIRFLSDPGESFDALDAERRRDPSRHSESQSNCSRRSSSAGCTLVDTTCGSVLNVWKNVKRYSDEGFTSIIHGKLGTKRRAQRRRRRTSQAAATTSSSSIAAKRRPSATTSADGGDRTAFLETFERAIRLGSIPTAISRVGCANQTTMLSSESLEIGEMFKQAMVDRYGDAASRAIPRVRHDLQRDPGSPGRDPQLLGERPLDLMIVLGGYNSSNTCNLARICAERVPTFHIADPDGLASTDEIRHRPVHGKQEVTSRAWLPSGSDCDWADVRSVHPR